MAFEVGRRSARGRSPAAPHSPAAEGYNRSHMKSSALRIVVLGMMGRCPYGGQTWLYLNWLRAFSRLGHDVYYVEDDSVWPYDPTTDSLTDDCVYAVRH